MIKPYKILSTRQENSGTAVEFSVSIRYVVDTKEFKGERTSESTSMIFVPSSENIDQYLHDYLFRSGWITE